MRLVMWSLGAAVSALIMERTAVAYRFCQDRADAAVQRQWKKMPGPYAMFDHAAGSKSVRSYK